MEETFELLRKLANSKFFGALVIKFEAGKVVLLKKEETIKPTLKICRDNRGNNGTNI